MSKWKKYQSYLRKGFKVFLRKILEADGKMDRKTSKWIEHQTVERHVLVTANIIKHDEGKVSPELLEAINNDKCFVQKYKSFLQFYGKQQAVAVLISPLDQQTFRLQVVSGCF